MSMWKGRIRKGAALMGADPGGVVRAIAPRSVPYSQDPLAVDPGIAKAAREHEYGTGPKVALIATAAALVGIVIVGVKRGLE